MWVFKGTRTIVVPKSEAESRTKHLSFHIEKRERQGRMTILENKKNHEVRRFCGSEI